MKQGSVFHNIEEIRYDQEAEYGERNALLEWNSNDLLAILAKQFGDVATVMKYTREQASAGDLKNDLRNELLHLAAVATMWLEKL